MGSVAVRATSREVPERRFVDDPYGPGHFVSGFVVRHFVQVEAAGVVLETQVASQNDALRVASLVARALGVADA